MHPLLILGQLRSSNKMSSPRRNLSESIPPQQKKPKLEEETPVGGEEDQVTTVKVEDQQLVERKWVKVAEVEEKKDQKLFKVMQWNSLADGLAHTSFIHCPAEALKWSYRGPLIIKEILRSGADIVCMEEVDHFDDFLRPQLERSGFNGLFVEKRNSPCLEFTPNNGPDGCALFYRSSKFNLVKKKEIVLDREDGSKSNQVAMLVLLRFVGETGAETESKVGGGETESTEKEGASTTRDTEDKAEIKLDEKESQPRSILNAETICIAVTHLKAKREGRDLRSAQGKHLHSEVASFSESYPVIVCGDFNATPDEPVYAYFSASESTYQYPLKLASSYVSRYYGYKEPPLTSWKFRAAGESKYTIDYIWFTPDTLKVDSIWTIPTEKEVGENGLPCTKYPSDHLSICTCFRL